MLGSFGLPRIKDFMRRQTETDVIHTSNPEHLHGRIKLTNHSKRPNLAKQRSARLLSKNGLKGITMFNSNPIKKVKGSMLQPGRISI